MNRRKKREGQCPDEYKPVTVPTPGPEPRPQHEYICEGCSRVTENYFCEVYAFVPSYYIRQGCCYFNRPEVKAKKKKTMGQQKQGRVR